MGVVLFATSSIRLDRSINSTQLHQLTSSNQELESYLTSQKHADPHFVTIANLVQSDQQSAITRALLFTGLPILIIGGVSGYIVARKLLKPVEDTFASQERFLQDASHEMRNPLAVLSAVSQQAMKSTDQNEQKHALRTLDRQIQHLVKLNEDLLLLERSKNIDKQTKQTNISELLLDTIDSITPQASKENIRLSSSVQNNAFTIINDQDFVCVLRNLLDNAVKYSPKNGEIKITLKKLRQQIRIDIKDKGIGIAKEELDHLGERFFRGKNVGRIHGTGLGYAIIYELARKYRFEVKIQSKEKKGTTVTLLFNMAREESTV